MNNRDGQVLTPSVAQELIIELFAGWDLLPRQDIVRAVDEAHTERGGQPPRAGMHHPVTYALSRMEQFGFAENPEGDFWSIFSPESSPSEEPIYIKTLSKFTEWAKRFNPGKYVFRGVPNEIYGIQASAFRRPQKEYRDFDKFLRINKDLIDEAKLRGYNERDGRQLADLEILAELQHFGAATCLIDFSYSAQIALWFACQPDFKISQGSGDTASGKVFAVCHQSRDFEEIDSGNLTTKKIDEFLQDSKNPKLYHWQPRQQNNRIIAQQSIFLFGRYEFDADDQCVIEASCKQEILTELQQVSGITEAMLFPDFGGFARLRSEVIPYMGLSAHEYRELAYAQFEIGKYNEAIAYYNEAIDQDPDYAEAYYWRGRAKHYNQRSLTAVSDFDKFISMNRGHAEAYYYRAEAKFYLRRFVDSKADLEEALLLAEESNDRRFIFSIRSLLAKIGVIHDE